MSVNKVLNKVAREWLEQVEVLTGAGLSRSQAEGVIAVLAKHRWIIVKYDETEAGKESAS